MGIPQSEHVYRSLSYFPEVKYSILNAIFGNEAYWATLSNAQELLLALHLGELLVVLSDHMKCQGSKPDQPHISQAPYQLYYHSGPIFNVICI